MGMAAILVKEPTTILAIFHSPQPKEASYEIWAKLAQRFQRRSRLKFWTFFPYKCIRKQIDRTVKRSNVNVQPSF